MTKVIHLYNEDQNLGRILILLQKKKNEDENVKDNRQVILHYQNVRSI